MITNLASFFFHQIREVEREADRVYEPVIGIVTDNKDPDKLMRVKVKIPALSSQDTTWWVPVVSLGAGKERGWFFLPEVNDEVLVAFEHGDMNRPIIIGALWNGQDKPPEQQSSSNAKRVMKSRAGSLIEIDDEQNTITISDGGGKGVIKFEASSNKLTIEAKQGDVVIQAPAKELKVVATGNIEMTANTNLEMRGGQNVNVTGMGVTLKADGPMQVTAGQTQIQQAGASQAATASTSPQDVADPIGS